MTYVYPVFGSAGATRYSPRYRDHRQQIKLDIKKLATVINNPQQYQAFIETLPQSRGDEKMRRMKK
jgi:hypothetical protein